MDEELYEEIERQMAGEDEPFEETQKSANKYELLVLLAILMGYKRVLDKAYNKSISNEGMSAYDVYVSHDMQMTISEEIFTLNRIMESESLSFMKRQENATQNDLQKNLQSVFEKIPDTSGKEIKPDEIAKQWGGQVNDYFRGFIRTKANPMNPNNLAVDSKGVISFFTTLVEDDIQKVVERKMSVDEAIKSATKKLSDSGLQVIEYDSGTTRQVDVWVRQQMEYANKMSSQQLLFDNARSDGITVFEFDAHADARPTHQVWQGHRFDVNGVLYPTLQNLTHGEHLDYNCRHYMFPVYDVDAPPMFTQHQLDNINTKPFTYNGKQWDGYEAKQEMRRQERNIRALKKRAYLEKQAGNDTSKIDAKIRDAEKKYRDFTDAYGTYPRIKRITIYEP